MSADNGHAVMKIYESTNEYGIFYYNASATYYHSYYKRENATAVYSHPVAAILEAHRLEAFNRTEYGVSVSDVVLKDCEDYYKEWRIEG